MEKNSHSSVIWVVLINIFSICIAQVFYTLMLLDIKDVTISLLFFLPLIIVSVNLILWLSKFRIKFFWHLISAYIGYFCSVFVFYFIHYINIDKSYYDHFPPGEAYWDLFLFVCINTALQLTVLFSSTVVIFLLFLLYKGTSYVINGKYGDTKKQ